MNIADELERCLPAGPPHRSVEQRIAGGRRLMRRRRVAGLAVALAVVVGLGAGYAAVGSDGDRASEPPIADRSPKHGDAEPTYSRAPEIRLIRPGDLVLPDGVQVLQEIDNPLALEPPAQSRGVAYTFEGTTRWSLVTRELESAKHCGCWTWSQSSEVAFRSFPTFEYWLADAVAIERGERPLELVRFGDGEELLPLADVEILQQTGDVNLGRRFAAPGERTAVAEVIYAGERWYVLARESRYSGMQYFPTAASVSRPTLEEFLPYAKGAYEHGDGLR